MVSVILAIDAGSSSIRCTGYEFTFGDQQSGGPFFAHNNDFVQPTSAPPSPVKEMDGISHTIRMASVVPNTGCVRIHEVLSAVDKCIDEVLGLLRQSTLVQNSSFQIVAIGFSTFAMNLIGVDVFGEPVGEAATLSYACNREDVVKECESLKSDLGPEKLQALYQRTGAPMHAAYATPQLLAFYSNEKNKSMIKQVAKWKTISSICVYRWSGNPFIQMPISYSEASWTGMFNFRKCSWDDEVVDILERCCDAVPRSEEDEDFDDEIDILPPLVDYDADLPFLRNGIPRFCDDRSENIYWARWPELRSSTVSLFLGIGDGAAANMGSKCGAYSSGSHRIAVTIGTSAAARVCLYRPMDNISTSANIIYGPDICIPPGLFCYRVDRFRILLGGALTDGGSVVEWARSLFNLQSPQAFDACMDQVSKMYQNRCTIASSTSCSPGGVTMIPFLSGERSTGFRGGARACVSGITRETTAVDIMYACLESVILRMGCVLKLVNEVCNSHQDEGDISSQGIIVASGNALE
ncbi:hypothetical protein ACHAXR_003347, partial [Thalassiosira sp. AJA248-18]